MDTNQFANWTYSNLINALRDIPVMVLADKNVIFIKHANQRLCSFLCEDGYYQFQDYSDHWRHYSTYRILFILLIVQKQSSYRSFKKQ